MNKLQLLRRRRNSVIKEYVKLAEENMAKGVVGDPLEMQLLHDWGEMNEEVIRLKKGIDNSSPMLYT